MTARILSISEKTGGHRPPLQSIRLVGGRVATGARTALRANVEILKGRIGRVNLEESPARGATVNLEGYLILPGLINSHDHLEFNLFPRLGRGPYPNAQEWARDIYRPERSPLREHLSVPKPVRLWWGGIKNLLSGVTTVCHHNSWDNVLNDGFPVRVVRHYGWAHSLAFQNNVAAAFHLTAPEAPFLIHLGEGTDEVSREEIFTLDRIGTLNERTVLIHGVALNEAGHALRRKRGAALVWCPTSNRFTLGSTLDVRSISRSEDIALGSDSALTARGNLLDEIRAAHEEEHVPEESIYGMVTEPAARILRLRDGEGKIQTGSIADLIAIPWTEKTPAKSLMSINAAQIEMVMVSGRLHLASPGILRRWPAAQCSALESISVEGTQRLVRAPIQWLLSETRRCLPEDLWLAGRRVAS